MVLGVKVEDTDEVIRAAYRKIATRSHPSQHTAKQEEEEQRRDLFREVTRVRLVLHAIAPLHAQFSMSLVLRGVWVYASTCACVCNC